MPVKIHVTKKEAAAVEWALDPMIDFWCNEDGAHGRGESTVYELDRLPRVEDRTLILSDVDDVNSDLLYRVGMQLLDMALQSHVRDHGTARVCRSLKHKLAQVGVVEEYVTPIREFIDAFLATEEK